MNGRILIAEPKFHVLLKRFQEILVSAQESGLNLCETPCLRFSRSVVLKNNSFLIYNSTFGLFGGNVSSRRQICNGIFQMGNKGYA
jgi:hypothetical protein